MELLSYTWSLYCFATVVAAGYWIRSRNVALCVAGAVGLFLLAIEWFSGSSSSPWMLVFRLNLVIAVTLAAYFARSFRERLSRHPRAH